MAGVVKAFQRKYWRRESMTTRIIKLRRKKRLTRYEKVLLDSDRLCRKISYALSDRSKGIVTSEQFEDSIREYLDRFWGNR